jgi:hypothetical protein
MKIIHTNNRKKEREREINPDQALNKIYYVLEKTKERKER